MAQRRKSSVTVRAAWIAFAGAIVAAFIAVGPSNFVDQIRSLIGLQSAPVILQIVPSATKSNSVGEFVATTRNPSSKPVTITAYSVTPDDTQPAAYTGSSGNSPKAKAEDLAAPCGKGSETRRLGNSITIQPSDTLDIVIRPWTAESMCNYRLHFESTNGRSNDVVVELWKSRFPNVRAVTGTDWQEIINGARIERKNSTK